MGNSPDQNRKLSPSFCIDRKTVGFEGEWMCLGSPHGHRSDVEDFG
jgi:hypothetical protein